MEDRRIDVGSVARVILMILVLAIWMLAVLSLRADADEPPVVFDKDKQGWTVPPGFTKYKQTRYSQRVTVTNGRETILPWRTDHDDTGINFHIDNPNRLFPYRVPAGLDEASGWTSETYYSLPEGTKIKVWTSRVPIMNGGLLPKRNWRFPDGAKFIEVLSTTQGVFEVRQRIRKKSKWMSNVLYRSSTNSPEGYTGKLGKSCAECHDKAGASEAYGVTVKGDGGVFSFPVLKEGTVEWRDDLPLEFASDPITDVGPRFMQPSSSVFPPRRVFKRGRS